MCVCVCVCVCELLLQVISYVCVFCSLHLMKTRNSRLPRFRPSSTFIRCVCVCVCVRLHVLLMNTHSQGFEFVQSLELEDEAVRMNQYEDFAKVIRTMVQHYVDKVSTHVPQYIGDLKTVSH